MTEQNLFGSLIEPIPSNVTVPDYCMAEFVVAHDEMADNREECKSIARDESRTEEDRAAAAKQAKWYADRVNSMRDTARLLGFGLKIERKTGHILCISHRTEW